jgi:hypothetical protein
MRNERFDRIGFTALVFWCGALFAQTGASDYFPLEVGNRWDYANRRGACTDAIVERKTIGGPEYFNWAMQSGGGVPCWIRKAEDAVYILNEEDGTECVLFDFGADAGQTWELPFAHACDFGVRITMAAKADTVTTPAGVFECLHFTHQAPCMDAGVSDTWFARGIGLVRIIGQSIDGPVDSRLTAYQLDTSAPRHSPSDPARTFQLYQNYPNPFNATTVIPYFLPEPGLVRLTVFDARGRVVSEWSEGRQEGGYHEKTFDASRLAAGVYWVRISVPDWCRAARKMILLK